MAHQEPPLGELETSISSEVVRIYLDSFGKGPLRSDTYLNGHVITTLLREVFTPAEKLLAGDGKAETVLATRIQWQRLTAPEFKARVEVLTGRIVKTTISGFDIDNDFATEVFVLEPV